MILPSLVNEVSLRTGVPPKRAKFVIKEVMIALGNALEREERIYIREFGKWRITLLPGGLYERTWLGKPVKKVLPPRKAVRFRAMEWRKGIGKC
jgi:nucleoid DNA-binding protein